MSSVYITDYIDHPDIEKKVLGDLLSDTLHSDIKVLLVWHEKIDDAFMDHLPLLQGIVRYGVGHDNLDLTAASERGIYACNTPDYGTEEVADTATAMILNIARGVTCYDFLCRNYTDGSWQENTLSHIKRNSDIKIGIIGCGRIGGSVAMRAKALNFQVAMYDPYQPRGYEKMVGIERIDCLEELLGQSDIVSVHTPLTQETRGMIDQRFITAMKPGASLVNTARGCILNNLNDLYHALRSSQLSSCAFDVFPDEPPPHNHPLITAWRNREPWLNGRLIINPHSAYFSSQAYYEMRHKASHNALRILQNEKPYNWLNKGTMQTLAKV
ncbi:C-terminal binding protein [Simkania negevensis]|uniref:C-terminal binding protein n=1 Tax=Simkania negevensis TaxID=83561 RepID=A0ABS3AQ32_9BACT|nr:C-terminal binding protein [Simkania negevensis]